MSPAELHAALRGHGIRCVLHQPECRPVVVLSFVLTASHSPNEIDRALDALNRILPARAVSERRPAEQAI
jgi:hypothetical protein